jgi:subtilisin family serine protease
LVAVIDTGMDVEHPELKGRIREHLDVSERGWSADAHGTAVAGIIAANADNGLGSYGVAPEAEILALKACQPKEGGLEARCWTSTLVKALDVAMARDAGVINMSLAGPPDALLARYVDLATGQNRVVVAAAGNGGPNAKPGFPAALPDVLAVTAVDAGDALYKMANVGDYIDVAAPGVDIVTPAPDGGYPPLSGTSMAAAHMSGIAALLREAMPMMSGKEIAAVLKTNVADLGVAGRDTLFGAGLIDACAAAELVSAAAIVCPQAPEATPSPAAAIEAVETRPDIRPETGASDELVIELD